MQETKYQNSEKNSKNRVILCTVFVLNESPYNCGFIAYSIPIQKKKYLRTSERFKDRMEKKLSSV